MNKMDDVTKMNLYNLREYIHSLEFRRDKIGCGQDTINRLNDAHTELASRYGYK